MPGIPICVKTPKGIEEVEKRSQGLSLRARRVLIMVDGKRDATALTAMIPNEDVPAILETLLAEGYLAPLQTAAPTKSTEPPADDATRFEMARNFMRNTVNAFLGVMGSGLIDNLERCTTIEELRGLYASWQEAIRLSSDGRKQLAELESRLAALLS